MKHCPTKLQLEAAVLGEAPAGRLDELDAHADGCARCRHELSWLRAESAMFAQRHARDEVSRLWESVGERRAEKRSGRLTRAMFAIAASLILAVVAGRFGATGRAGSQMHAESVPMSLETMSVDRGDGELATMPCYTPGFGIACGEVEYATR
ncbi:MAG: hypothetical protein JNK82_45615 [Myxococcaceae bacterium]|nr:hypothetical protein [Myxococcaceae bacterium]